MREGERRGPAWVEEEAGAWDGIAAATAVDSPGLDPAGNTRLWCYMGRMRGKEGEGEHRVAARESTDR